MSDTLATLLWGTLVTLVGHSWALLLKSPKVNRHVSKASVSYETCSKDTRQVCKTSDSYETPSKSHASKSPKRPFHIASYETPLMFKQLRSSSPSKPQRLTRDSQCHTATLTSTKHRNLTITCICHKNSTSTPLTCTMYCACHGK